MPSTELQIERLALHRGAIADAVDLELLLESLGDAGHQIGDQRARGAPHRARLLGLVLRIEFDGALVELHHDVVRHEYLQGAFRPLHLHRLAFHIGGDASGNRDRLVADP